MKRVSDSVPRSRPSLVAAMTSWRTASVVLLSFASGLPLGLIWIAIPDWMRSIDVDIRVVGLITLAQAPWSFKMLWSPLMDRYTPAFLGRRRGWTLIAQVGLFAGTLALAGVGSRPEAPWVVGALALAIAFAAATQDIAVDAYAVDVLRKEEQGMAVGARISMYRIAMLVAGSFSITAAARLSWPVVNVILACLFLPLMIVTWKAPEPEVPITPPKTLREAVWQPFLGLLGRHRALEILLFVVCYKLADNLAGALLRPFLRDMGYDAAARGIGTGMWSLFATIGGTLLGSTMTQSMGVGRALWISGILQIGSNVGYVMVSRTGVNLPLMYGSVIFETFTTGMGTGAFSVLLLRLTQKRFSATQYAVLSSIFSLPRVVAGPITGYLVHALGWTNFLWLTIVSGLPGLGLLYRICPPSVREPEFEVLPPREGKPATVRTLATSGAAAALVIGITTALLAALLDAMNGLRAVPPRPFDFAESLRSLTQPQDLGGWTTLLGVVVIGAIGGFFVAAVTAARHGTVTEKNATNL
jgi:PAT family beta-lactamase induction signal transducer AmpG